MSQGQFGTMKAVRGRDVRDRIKLMWEQIGKSLRWPMTRTLAVQMILDARCPAQNLGDYSHNEIDECQVNAIYWGFKSNGMYLGDIIGLDTYQTVQRTYELGLHPSPILAAAIPQYKNALHDWYEGTLQSMFSRQITQTFVFDCDDAVISLCSLLGSVGFRSGAKVISTTGDVFDHVYAVVELPRMGAEGKERKIVTLDATEYEAYPGWEPPASMRQKELIYWYDER